MKMSAKIVEISRSKYGYGFTLSGEMPCRLTQVKGHATTVGLKSGDLLHCVNGEVVEHLSHADVVALITKAPGGRLKLAISPGEDCYEETSETTTTTSDSDDDDGGGGGGEAKKVVVEVARNGRGRAVEISSGDEGESSSSAAASSSAVSRHRTGHRTSALRTSRTSQPHQPHQRKHSRPGPRSNAPATNNILRPSQTYETNGGATPQTVKLRHRPPPPRLRNRIDPYGLLHLSDSDMPVERSREYRYSRTSRPKSIFVPSNPVASSTRFQSIDNLHRRYEDESLLLHGHYRNRLKCRQVKDHQQAQGGGGSGDQFRVKGERKIGESLQVAIGQTKDLVRRTMAADGRQKEDLRPSTSTTGNGGQNNQMTVDVDVHQHPPPSTTTSSVPSHPHQHLDPPPNDPYAYLTSVHPHLRPRRKSVRQTNSTTSGISSTSPSSGPSSANSSPASTTTRSVAFAESSTTTTNNFKIPAVPVAAKRTSRQKKSTQISSNPAHLVSSPSSAQSTTTSNISQSTALLLDSDCHASSILRAIVRCLSITVHHLDRVTAKTCTELIRNQLTSALATNASPYDTPTSSPILIAAYTDELHLVSYHHHRTAVSSSDTSLTVIRSNQLVHCALPLPEDTNYFAIVASAEDNGQVTSGQSMYQVLLFAVDRSQALSHARHQDLARQFDLNCTTDPITGNCLEFPENSSQILRVLFSLYRKQLNQHCLLLPTAAATTATTYTPQLSSQIARNRRPLLLTTSFTSAVEAEAEEEKEEEYEENKVAEVVRSVTLESNGSNGSSRSSSSRTSRRCRALPVRTPPLPPRTSGKASDSLTRPANAQIQEPQVSVRQADLAADPAEDSSPSCCATTSCDSFSFEQFQAHLRTRAQQQNLQSQNSLGQPTRMPKQYQNPNQTRVELSTAAAAAVKSSVLSTSASVAPWQQSSEHHHHHHHHHHLQPNLNLTRHNKTCQIPAVPVPVSDSAPYHLLSSRTTHTSSSRPKSLFNPFDASNQPLHFLLDTYSSCNDLSFNSFQLESQFNPANVRQATQKYLMQSAVQFSPTSASSSSTSHHFDLRAPPPPPPLSSTSGDRQMMLSSTSRDNSLNTKQLSVSSPSNTEVPPSGAISFKQQQQQQQPYCYSDNEVISEAGAQIGGSTHSEVTNEDGHSVKDVKTTNLITSQQVPDLVSNQILEVELKQLNRVNSVLPVKAEPLATGGKTTPSPPPSQSIRNGNDNDEYDWMESPTVIPVSERPVDVGWVGGWATDFDILLSDPVGLKAFTDFLCKEFSYENLQFFLAIQEFKKLDGANQDEIRARAQEIYETYISNDATDPVNVDSKGRKAAEVELEASPIGTRVFGLAEKQIYNLMKFDSYQRFLKSDIFKECASLDLMGKPLPYETDYVRAGTNGTVGAEVKAVESKAKTKRKSIIPWARIKSSIANAKAASLSSMPKEGAASFRRPMMRKFANSIIKIRSKSLDDHIHHQVKQQQQPGQANPKAASTNGHSSSVDKAPLAQQSLSHGDSRGSFDLSEHSNVFSPSPDGEVTSKSGDSPASREIASVSTESGTTSSSTEHSPVSNNSGPGFTASHHSCTRDNCHFLRVSFPDRSQTVVPGTPNETLDSLVKRLLLKRNLDFAAFDVFRTGENVPLDLTLNINTLGCTELRVEQRVMFQLDLPNDNEVIGVKSKPNLLCSLVFRSLLSRQGYRWEHVLLTLDDGAQTPVDMTKPLASVDGQRVLVSYRDDLEEYGWNTSARGGSIPAALNASLKSSSSKASSLKQAGSQQVVVGSAALNQSAISNPTGDDTASDAFYRDVLKSGPQSPNCSPYKIVAPALLQQHRQFQNADPRMGQLPQVVSSSQESSTNQVSPGSTHQSTSSVAYGIVTPAGGVSIKPQRSLEEPQEPPKQSSVPMRRFSSVTSHEQSPRVLNEIDLDSVNTQATPPTRATYKAAHLRELQHHQNFQSYADGGIQESTNRIYMPVSAQYPIDLNSTAEEIKLLGAQSQSQVPPPPMPLSMAPHQAALDAAPEKPPLRRFQADLPPPPPLPPKPFSTTSATINNQNGQSGLQRQPPLSSSSSTSQQLPSASLFQPLEHAPTHQPHHNNHNQRHSAIYNHHIYGDLLKYNYLDV